VGSGKDVVVASVVVVDGCVVVPLWEWELSAVAPTVEAASAVVCAAGIKVVRTRAEIAAIGMALHSSTMSAIHVWRGRTAAYQQRVRTSMKSWVRKAALFFLLYDGDAAQPHRRNGEEGRVKGGKPLM
jgi:hypothetical protein